MPRQFTRSRSGGHGAKRQTRWLGFAPLIDTASDSSVLISSADAAILSLRPFTIIRTIIEIEHGSDQSVATEAQLSAVGLAVVSDISAAAGIASLPKPVTDIGSDLWFAHQSMVNLFTFKSGVGFESPSSSRYTINSKAMRRVNNDQDIVFVFENSIVGGGATISTLGRMLIKLH